VSALRGNIIGSGCVVSLEHELIKNDLFQTVHWYIDLAKIGLAFEASSAAV